MYKTIIPQNIPSELKELNRWAVWVPIKNEDGKIQKPPVNPRTGKFAKTNDPSTWVNFKEALEAYKNGEKYGGVSFALSEKDSIVGVDIDNCVINGKVDSAIWEDIKAIDSYTELSPSRTGIRIFAKGKLPCGGKHKGNIEIYESGKFLTVTGFHLPGTPLTINERHEEITQFFEKHFGVEETYNPEVVPVPFKNDEELLETALNAANGDKFRKLFVDGDWSDYPSQSEADFALCNMLAFYTGRDAEWIKRLFQKSALYRSKCEKRRGNGTYLERTIAKAIERTKEVYGNKEQKKQMAVKNSKTNKDERKTRQTSFFTNGETLLEQIYVDGRSMFLAYNTTTGEAKTIPFLELEEEIIEPINGEDVELGAIKLPSGITEYGDTLSLLAEIETHIYRYLDVSPTYQKFAAYYILLSWLYDRFHTLPYLRALGDTGCGKSRFLDVIGGLCYKSISASGCVTPAPIYRMLRKWQGTLVLDEADMKNSDEYNEVITILNCGFERGRPVIRATKDNPDKVQILPVYGPKVFATRRRFKDVALEARCLTHVMRETDRDDIPPVLGKKFFEEQQELRNKLLLFRLRSYFSIDTEATASLNLDGIEPRLRQISEAFASLFANEPEVLESYRRFIQAHQRELIEQRAATKTGQVVEALFELLEERGGTSVTSGTSYMVESELVTGISAGDIAEKIGLSSQAVGAILKGLGLETKLNRRGSERKREIIYNEAIFRKLRKRYILKEGPEQPTLSTNSVVPVVPLVTTEQDNEKGTFEREGSLDALPV